MGVVNDLLTAPPKQEERTRLLVGEQNQSSPDRAGRVLGLQMKTGLPVDLIERNLDAVEQRATRADFNVDRFRQESPIFAEWAAENQNHLAATRDDVENLTGLEWAVKAFSSAHQEQWRTIELGQLRARQMAGELGPDGEERIVQLKGEGMGSDFGAEEWYEKVVVETGRLLPTLEFVAKEGAERGLATGAGFAGIAALAGQAGPQVLAPEELITVPTAAVMGLGFGTASGAAEAAYDLEAGLAYDEYLDMRDDTGQPLDPGVAKGAAAMVGLINAGLESFGLGMIASRIPGVNRLKATMGRQAVKAALAKPTFRQAVTRFAANYATVMGTEVTTEILQEATTILGAEIAGALSEGEFKGLTAEQIGNRLAEIAVKTTQGMAVIGAVGPGMQFVTDARRAQRANENQAIFEALGAHATDSKLRQRVPEKFREYVRRLREGGDIDTVRIPVERFAEYFQSRELDPAEVAAELTGSTQAYAEAQAAGTDIEIPLEAYATRIAPTEHHQALVDDLRLRPDDMTLRESRAWREQADELTESLASEILTEPTDAAMPVYEDVLGQLLQTGMERGAAEQNATLMASVFETLGQRTGQDPNALYQRYGLQVQREVPEVLKRLENIDVNIDPLIDRLRSGKVPADREVYGPSLSEFLREHGGLQDQGGELAARDAGKAIRGLVKPNGLLFDHAAELAQEAGYITERSDNALLAALEREIDGEAVFRPDAVNQQLLDLRMVLDDLSQYLQQEGVDLETATNDQVRELLQATVFDQSQLDMFASAQAAAAAEPSVRSEPAPQVRSQPGLDLGPPAERAEPAAAAPEPAAATPEATEESEIAPRASTDDVGEQLWYNRRNFTGKGIEWSEIEGLNPTLKAKEVSKTKVWPRPNYEQLIADGLDPIAANLIKQVYDSIATKPPGAKDEQLKLYVEGVQKLRDATFEFVHGIDMVEVAEKLEAVIASGSGYAWAQKSELSKVLGVERRDQYSSAHFPLVEAMFPLPEGERSRFRGGEQATANNTLAGALGGNRLLKELSVDAESVLAALKAVAEGWPKPQEAWQKRFQIHEATAGQRVVRNGQAVTLEGPEFFLTKKGTRRILADGFKTREEAVEHARGLTKREGVAGPAEQSMSLDRVRREGVARREGDVTSEQLMETFGFRGINFGNWMKGKGNEAERQAHINNAYDSFADLAALLNVPPKAMGLNGMLGLAFGAQGRGGGAKAHFVPGVNEINLTRESGAGSLAHEWGHALDHYFNNQVGESAARSTDPFLTDLVKSRSTRGESGLRPEIMEAFRTIVREMTQRDETPEEIAARVKMSREAAVKRTQNWLDHFRKRLEERAGEAKAEALAEFDALAAKIAAGELGEYANAGKSTRDPFSAMRENIVAVRTLFKKATGRVPPVDDVKGLSSNAEHLRYMLSREDGIETHGPMALPTKFAASANRLDRGKGGKAYWSTPWEMFARAFESYVLDRLEDQAIRNDYLVASTKTEAFHEAAVELGVSRGEYAYPAGDERVRINAAFDNLVSNIKTEETDGGVRLFQSANPQTETPEFEAWFGDSKVVDENGAPLVVYHGTADDITEFRVGGTFKPGHGKQMPGIYFSALPATASAYARRAANDKNAATDMEGANVIPAFVSIQNPAEFTEVDEFATADRAELEAQGFDGAVRRNQEGQMVEIVAFSPEQVKSAVGNRGTFDPGNPSILNQEFNEARRGSIQFGANRQFRINLLKQADLSTFIHESGHFYLEVLGDVAEAMDAPEQVVQDYAAILGWLGVESRQAITREHHEQFARGFEAYLMEGKAPSVALQNAFARFRAWLVSIYRQIAALNVKLTDEVRGVFDRLVATDDAIQHAEESQNYVALFTDAETAGMSAEQFEAYKSTVQKARIEAEETLSTKLLGILTREQKKWWKDQREAVRAEVTEEVHGMRTYRALTFLQSGKNPDGTDVEGVTPVKLSKAVLVDAYGYPQDFLKRLPGAGKTTVYSVDGGVHPDVIAAMFGYESGGALIQDLANARPMRQLIEAETDARMRERFPDPLTDGSLAEQAIDAVHSDKRAELLAAELRALRKKQREVRPFVRAAKRTAARERREGREANRAMLPDRDELRLIRAAAERMVGQKAIRSIKPATFRSAESKAARKAFDAAARGDYETAYAEKRRQLLNHELFRAAEKGIEQADKIRDYFTKFSKKRVRERLGKAGEGLLEKIESVLEGISLKRVSGSEIERAEAKREVLKAIDSGQIVTSPATVQLLKSGTVVNWRELSLDQFVGMHDVVRQLETQAKALAEAIVNGEKIEIKAAAEAVAASILEGGKPVEVMLGSRGPMENAKRNAKQALLAWLRPSEIARQLDGGKDFGPVLRTIIEPIRRAYAEKLIPAERKIREDVADLYRQHYSNEELGQFRQRIFLPELGTTITRGDLLSLALNWGNEGNRQAILDSQFEGQTLLTSEGVAQALGRLTARDWAFAQSVWDYIDTYWQPIAEIEKRRRGVAPRKVEAAPFEIMTSDGQAITVRGGYYPLQYDSELSDTQRSDDIENAFDKFVGMGNITASTRAGSTHERVGSGKRAVRLGLGVIDRHLHEVVRDIALGDEARFVYRVLNQPEVRAAMAKTGNADARETLMLWLKDAAVGEQAARGFVNKSSAYLRVGFTKAKLAWNLTTTLLQVTGLPQTMVVVGQKAFAHGFGQYLTNPVANHQRVMEVSAFMRARYRTNSWNKDVADTKAYLESYFGGVPTRTATVVNALSYSYFWPIARLQMLVDEVTWLAGYWKGANERGLADDAAAIYADSVVENAQTSGFFSDRSGIERGTTDTLQQRQSQFVKLWTTLISYMLAKGNITYARGRQLMRNPSLWGATTFAADVVLLFAVEAILAGLIRGRLPDEDDDDSFLTWLGKEVASSAIAGVPFVREIASAKYGSGNTPLGSLATDFYKAMVQAEQGEADAALIKSINNVGGTLFHYPSGQLNKGIDAYWREHVEGEDVPAYEYATGKRN